MFQPGDIVLLRYDDQEETQGIIGREVEVVSIDTHSDPFWMTVTDGVEKYSVRGNGCCIKRLYDETKWEELKRRYRRTE